MLLLLALGAWPWGMFKPQVEQRLSEEFGRPVTIQAMRRIDRFSFRPVIELSGVTVPQPEWAGPGRLADIRSARIRFSAWALLTGRFAPDRIEVSGARLALVRAADGRTNWRSSADRGGSSSAPAIESLRIADTLVEYRDAVRGRSARVRVRADTRSGIDIAGTGSVRGAPVRIAASGAPFDPATAGRPWRFRAQVDGSLIGFTLDGVADRALDIGHFSGTASGRADDLERLDAILEAGLPGTQPVRLRAEVRRDGRDWRVSGLSGRIGRSDIAGEAVIAKRGDRTRIDGKIRSQRFDFDDLASDAGHREAAAKRARTGKRVVPDTAIDLATVDRTDGRLEIRVRELLWPAGQPFRSLSGVLTLERSLLRADPLMFGLSHGRMAGVVTVDQRSGGPTLDARLRVTGSRLSDFFPSSEIDAPLSGHVRLKGPGRTVREAVGRSSGSMALIAREGVIPARTASILGLDVGRGLTTGRGAQARLRCIVARLDVRDGIARPAPAIIDTSRAQSQVTGSIRLSDERLALSLRGAPKRGSLLRLSDPVRITGTVKAPDIAAPRGAASVGGILKMMGKAITGDQGALATDADCGALAARAAR